MEEPDNLYEKLVIALKDALYFVKQNELDFFKWSINNHYSDYPTLSYNKIGYPEFYKNSFLKKNYFGILVKDNYCENLVSWKEVIALLKSHKKFSQLYDLENKIAEDQNVFPIITICKLVKRYIDLYNTFDFNEKLFKDIYIEWKNYIIEPKLSFNIIVPILMLTFDFDEYEISDSMSIVRLSDEFQKSRNTISGYNSIAHDRVISSATHGFVWKSFTVDNELKIDFIDSFSNINTYSEIIEFIDNFFALIRIRTGCNTGYYQIIAEPIGWANGWTADLLPLKIMLVRNLTTKLS